MSEPSLREVVACQSASAEYPDDPPFSPSQRFAEYEFADLAREPNHVYETVRRALAVAGLDAANLDTPAWNPLAGPIKPGETVLLKPNLVKEYHPRDPDGWRYVLTHGSVIRALCDFVFKAVGPTGKVIVADAPQTDSSFAKIASLLGLNELKQYYAAAGLKLEIVDLRKQEWTTRDAVVVERRDLPGDPLGYTAFNLASNSEFVGHFGEGRLYGADYDEGEVNRHHSGGRHEYLIATTPVAADVVFSIPKLKTHKKVGITVSLKNLVGINGDKNWLPHHTEAGNGKRGDERPEPGLWGRAERALVRTARKASLAAPIVGTWLHRQSRRMGTHVFGDTEEIVRSGNWWGNDTCWRMCLDLNKCLFYGNADGSLRPDRPESRKRHYSLVDGIIGGEGSGPMNPDPFPSGVVVLGFHPASVDAACAILMGYDPEAMPIIRQAFRGEHYALAEWDWRDVALKSDHDPWNGLLPEISPSHTFHFRPHFGWAGRILRTEANQPA